jgi:hypothetical protein
MEGEATLIWGVLFGAIGLGYCVYARQQRSGMALISGIGLMFFPYFVSNLWLLLLVGLALVLAPWFIRF